jgi:hypothetical protein
MTRQRGRLEKLMPDKTALSDVTAPLRQDPGIRRASRCVRRPITPLIDSHVAIRRKSGSDRLRPTA